MPEAATLTRGVKRLGQNEISCVSALSLQLVDLTSPDWTTGQSEREQYNA